MFLDAVGIILIVSFVVLVVIAAILTYLDNSYEERMRKKYPDIFQKKDKIEMVEQTFVEPLKRKMLDLEDEMNKIISKLDYYSPEARKEKEEELAHLRIEYTRTGDKLDTYNYLEEEKQEVRKFFEKFKIHLTI